MYMLFPFFALHIVVTKWMGCLKSDILHHIVLSILASYNFFFRENDDWYSDDMILVDREVNITRIASNWTFSWVTVSIIELFSCKKIDKQTLAHHIMAIVINRMEWVFPEQYHFHVLNVGMLEWSSIILAYAHIVYGDIKTSPLWLKGLFSVSFILIRLVGYYTFIFPTTIYYLCISELSYYPKWLFVCTSICLFGLNLKWGNIMVKGIIKVLRH